MNVKSKMLSCIKYYELMCFNFYSKKILKLLGISLIISFSSFEINTINQELKAQKNLGSLIINIY